MGEIKSTLELVMEKTKHLTLSDEEKMLQRRAEVEKKIYGLVQKYQNSLIAKTILNSSMVSGRHPHFRRQALPADSV